MIQDILTNISIVAAVAVALYNFYFMLFPRRNNSHSSCGHCTGCDFKSKITKYRVDCMEEKKAKTRFFPSLDRNKIPIKEMN